VLRAFFIAFFCLTCLSAICQETSLNPAYFLSAANPAFAVSPLDFSRISASFSTDDKASVYGHFNINSLYSALGAFVNYDKQGTHNAGGYAAYHTYFLPKEFHLMGGAQLKCNFRDGVTPFYSARFGILLCDPEGKRYFGGFAFDSGRLDVENPIHIYSAQIGSKVLVITRKMGLKAFAIGNFYDYKTGGKMNLLFQPTLYGQRWQAGPGWVYDTADGSQLLLRAGVYRGSYSASLVYSLPTFGALSKTSILDISIQYRI